MSEVLSRLKLARERIADPKTWHQCYCLGVHTWPEGSWSHLPGHYGWERAAPPDKYTLIGALTYPEWYPNEEQPGDWWEAFERGRVIMKTATEGLTAEIGSGWGFGFDVRLDQKYPDVSWNNWMSGHERLIRTFNKQKPHAEVLSLLDRTIRRFK